MVELTTEQIRELMSCPDNIRNVSLIGHLNHGKSTLINSLSTQAEIKTIPYTHDHDKTKEIPTCTIKSINISLFHEETIENTSNKYLTNLIDSPGHTDFSSEVAAALRLTDGAILVVDCVEGFCIQTESVLKQALLEKVKPVLMINKVDRYLLELQLDHESIYQNFCRIIEKTNSIIENYNDGSMGHLLIDPSKGNVFFGSALLGWAFSLQVFSKIYAAKHGVDQQEMTERLWGEWFFDNKKKKWSRNNELDSGKILKRGFCQFVIKPIQKLARVLGCKGVKPDIEGKSEVLNKVLKSLEIELETEEKEITGEKLLIRIMQKWLRFSDCVFHVISKHMPSPKQSQKYRVECLYEGPMNDECARSIRTCDPNGPVMIFVSKLVPLPFNKSFAAFSRVFSGTVSAGTKVRIMGPSFTPGKKHDFNIKLVQSTLIMSRFSGNLEDVPSGNLVALLGIDSCLIKTGTISTHDQAYPIKNLKYPASPILRLAVKPKHAADLSKLVEGLKLLNKSDLLVECGLEETGDHTVSGCGELHIETCIQDLIKYCGIEITKSGPVVIYKEIVQDTSSQVCLAKSPNKHNRLYVNAEPLATALSEDIEAGKIGPKTEPNFRASLLQDHFNWDQRSTKNIWAFGPENNGANLLVDCTKGVQNIQEIKTLLDSGFQWVTREGCLIAENMRGVRFNVLDAVLHTDAIHRGGGGQIIPTARRAYYAAFLTAKPAIQEPVLLVEVKCQNEAFEDVCQYLSSRRGVLISQELSPRYPFATIKSYLPVAESLELSGYLTEKTSGKYLPQCVLDHWTLVPGDPLDPGSKSYEIIESIRLWKGLESKIPLLDKYLDRL